jgi:hypothetical protein
MAACLLHALASTCSIDKEAALVPKAPLKEGSGDRIGQDRGSHH